MEIKENPELKKPAPVALPVAPLIQTEREIIARGLAEAAQALLKTANLILAGEASTHAPLPAPLHFSSVAPGRSHEARTVREAINEFLIAKARARVSDRYLRTLRVSLSAFALGRSTKFLHEVTSEEIERWIFGQEWAPKTMKGYLGDVRTLYTFARRRGYCSECPANAIELPSTSAASVAPCIHTPEEVQTVLESLRASDLDIMRLMAIRYFTGIRSAEAHRLREENILPGGFIEVPAHKAKTRSRRLVKIQPNLAAWLALGGTLRNLCPENVRQKIRLSKVDWKQNVTRHSFVSYHYAAFGDAKATAREAGHSEEILFANYRALVTEEAGRKYFAIFPRVTMPCDTSQSKTEHPTETL
jgi:integrase